MPVPSTVKLDDIVIMDNVRTEYDQASIEELANSILSVGVLQPLAVCESKVIAKKGKTKGDIEYALVFGHRRYKALCWLKSQRKIKGDYQVPVVERNLAPDMADFTVTQLIENLQRVDLSAIDEARGYYRMIEQHSTTQRDLAKRVGKAPSHIAKRLALLALPPEVQALVEHTLGVDEAYRLSRLPDKAINRLTKPMVEKGKHLDIYELEREEGNVERAKAEDKFTAAVAKHMIEVLDELPVTDDMPRERFEYLGYYDASNLTEYEPKKNHVVTWGSTGRTSIQVYRKLTPKQLEAAQQRKIEAREAADAKAEAAEAEWLENEATPYEIWEYEEHERYIAFTEAQKEWRDQADAMFGQIIRDMAGKEITKLVIGTVLGSEIRHAADACRTLGLHPPTHDDDGNELRKFERAWGETLDAWINGDNGRHLAAWLACTVTPSTLLDNPAFSSIAQAIEDAGLVPPTKPEPTPEPWYDEASDTWRTDRPDRLVLADGTEQPIQEDFDSQEEFRAAHEVFDRAWQLEQQAAIEAAA